MATEPPPPTVRPDESTCGTQFWAGDLNVSLAGAGRARQEGLTVDKYADVTTEYDSWQELLGALVQVRSDHNDIFRGQADADWPLVTTLERALRQKLPARDAISVERGVQRRFIDSAKLLLSQHPADDDELGWLTLMQHFGAPTRLLDWSKSPFIGLYFAYESLRSSPEGPRALWWLSALDTRQRLGTRHGFFHRDPFGLRRSTEVSSDGSEVVTYPGVPDTWLADENDFVRSLRDQGINWPCPVPPVGRNARLDAQQAYFTYDPALNGGVPVENMYIPGLDGKTKFPTIGRILLPEDWRVEVLAALRSMGITPASMFPGLDGLGRGAWLSASLPDELEDQLGL